MNAPLTRGDLRAEFPSLLRAEFPSLLREGIVEHQLVSRPELHTALETWAGAIIERILAGIDERFARIEQRLDRIDATMATKASTEDLARHARAIQESLAPPIAIIDEKYADLPGRVGRLETSVYKRTKRAKPGRASRSPAPRRR